MVMVTTVGLVRVTSLKVSPALTTASQPVASAWAESIPLISAVVMALSAPTVGSQVSLVRVMTNVSPPTAISPSVASGVTVPETAAEGVMNLMTVPVMVWRLMAAS